MNVNKEVNRRARKRVTEFSRFFKFLLVLVCHPNDKRQRPVIPWPLAPRASSYEPGNRAGSVTGTNFVVCSYGKFQPGRPG